jgi:uncharacterized protein YkwD
VAAVAVLFLWGVALGAPSESQARSAKKEMVRAVNAARADHGLKSLRRAPRLARSARAYARWMLRVNYFGHQRRIRTRARFNVLGETLAWHSGRPARVRRTVRAWLHSPPHRALVLSRRFHWIGAGTASGRLDGGPARTWVLHLGG